MELSDGDYLIVKRDLTAGEFRELMRASAKPITVGAGGATTLDFDPIAASFAMVLAYLLDWSFADADGRKLVIADQPASVVKAALDHIDSDAYNEVQSAINDHQAARAAALAEEKKHALARPHPTGSSTSVE